MRRRLQLRSTRGAAALVVVATLFLVVSVLTWAASRPAVTEARQVVEVVLPEDEVLRITYLGDSLTAGLFATTEERTYRSLSTTEMASGGPYEEQGTQIVGGTVEETLDGNEQLPQDQHVYVVELGTNDVAEIDYRVFAAQYEVLLDRVRAGSPDAALVCLGTWRPSARGASYDLLIRQMCEAHGGSYRQMADLQAEPSHRGPSGVATFEGPSDDFHPNDAGHAAIHERLMSAVTVRREG